jgi:hypothetical protein
MSEEVQQTTTDAIDDKILGETVSILLTAMESGMSATEGDRLRLNTGRLSYLDRLILLAGGSLTLVFTVVANLSVQLHASHSSARHPAYVAVSCWLLVSCIVSGLLGSAITLAMQTRENAAFALTHLDSKVKRALLEKKPNIDLSKLVGISEAFKGSTDVKKHSVFSRLSKEPLRRCMIGRRRRTELGVEGSSTGRCPEWSVFHLI